MATYYDIKGQKVQNRSSDPSPVQVGQVWYNTTSNTAKFQGYVATASWATGTNYPVSVRDASGFGTPNAAIILGGNAPPTTSAVNTYDGSSWTSTTALPANLSGADADGPQTAGLFAGGTDTTANYDWNGSSWSAETYDGTCWTTSASMNVARSNAHGKATLNGATSSLCATGNPGPAGFGNQTEDFTGAGPVTKTITTG